MKEYLINRSDTPAFPRPTSGVDQYAQTGMTLRDYFAAKAMQGMSAREVFDAGQASPQQRATLAYLEADAMMKAREA